MARREGPSKTVPFTVSFGKEREKGGTTRRALSVRLSPATSHILLACFTFIYQCLDPLIKPVSLGHSQISTNSRLSLWGHFITQAIKVTRNIPPKWGLAQL